MYLTFSNNYVNIFSLHKLYLMNGGTYERNPWRIYLSIETISGNCLKHFFYIYEYLFEINELF